MLFTSEVGRERGLWEVDRRGIDIDERLWRGFFTVQQSAKANRQ